MLLWSINFTTTLSQRARPRIKATMIALNVNPSTAIPTVPAPIPNNTGSDTGNEDMNRSYDSSDTDLVCFDSFFEISVLVTPDGGADGTGAGVGASGGVSGDVSGDAAGVSGGGGDGHPSVGTPSNNKHTFLVHVSGTLLHPSALMLFIMTLPPADMLLMEVMAEQQHSLS